MTAAREYLLTHGIDLEVAESCGVRSDGLNLYFPYETSEGRKYERTRSMVDGICRQPAGLQLDLFWPLGRSMGASVLLCEGEADTLAAASILDSTEHPFLQSICPVGLPGASAPTRRMARALFEAKALPVYICLDPDDAGRKATKRMVLELERLHRKAVPIDLPDGKDLADCIVEQGDAAEDWLANLIHDFEASADITSTVVSSVRDRLAA
jgi:hypothetical protein